MRYYTFEIDGKKVGYYEESNHDGVLHSNAKLVMNGEAFENPFWIRHADGKVIAYKFGDSEWLEFSEDNDVFPSSALPLLIQRAIAEGQFTYKQFNEGQAKITGSATLSHDGKGKITETVDGKNGRYVLVNDGIVVEYGWGGTAVSKLAVDKADATRGTQWEGQ